MSKLWGSKFDKGSDKLADQFSFSINYDYKLAEYDVLASIAHAHMLGKCKIISKTDETKLLSGLKKLGKQIKDGTFKYDPTAEDIHTNIQASLKKLIGVTADKLHTARSRNDLVVLDMKLYCLNETVQIVELVTELQKAIVGFADKYQETIIPGYTHLQPAQVVLLSHYVLAYAEMFDRDKSRLRDCFMRTDMNPLGSCAFSGSTLPIDRKFVTKYLGMAQTTDNSVDSVADRDFIIELLSTIAIMGMHFSRIAEDMIIWFTDEFDRITIDDAYCTGSSIMPHKKNPDMFELIRGESGKLISNLNEVLILMKGLPLTYNRDMQLDKPPLFESVEKIKQIIALTTKMFATMSIDEEQKEIIKFDVTTNEDLFSVDFVDYLISKGHTYREAHDLVGQISKDTHADGTNIAELDIKLLQKYSKKISTDVKKLFNPETSVKMKKSYGSTNPKMVKEQIEKWKKNLR